MRLPLLIAAASIAAVTAQAKPWAPRAAEPTPPIAVTCDDVRRAVQLVGLEAARAQARQMGMTRGQERRAARCLKGGE